MDALTTQAIVHRDSISKNYVPIIHPDLYLPMLQLRKDGDCEIADPRACLHHYNSAADLACLVFAEVSRFYFDAMVKAGYIAHGLRVVLQCTENDEFDERLVWKKEDLTLPREETVEEMIQKYKTKEGTCRPGADIINLETGYEFKEVRQRKRVRGAFAGANTGASASTVLTRPQWNRKLAELKKLYDCQRKLQTDEAARNVSTGAGACRKDAPPPEGRRVVPTLIIKAAWMFPGYENRRKMYSYRM